MSDHQMESYTNMTAFFRESYMDLFSPKGDGKDLESLLLEFESSEDMLENTKVFFEALNEKIALIEQEVSVGNYVKRYLRHKKEMLFPEAFDETSYIQALTVHLQSILSSRSHQEYEELSRKWILLNADSCDQDYVNVLTPLLEDILESGKKAKAAELSREWITRKNAPEQITPVLQLALALRFTYADLHRFMTDYLVCSAPDWRKETVAACAHTLILIEQAPESISLDKSRRHWNTIRQTISRQLHVEKPNQASSNRYRDLAHSIDEETRDISALLECTDAKRFIQEYIVYAQKWRTEPCLENRIFALHYHHFLESMHAELRMYQANADYFEEYQRQDNVTLWNGFPVTSSLSSSYSYPDVQRFLYRNSPEKTAVVSYVDKDSRTRTKSIRRLESDGSVLHSSLLENRLTAERLAGILKENPTLKATKFDIETIFFFRYALEAEEMVEPVLSDDFDDFVESDFDPEDIYTPQMFEQAKEKSASFTTAFSQSNMHAFRSYLDQELGGLSAIGSIRPTTPYEFFLLCCSMSRGLMDELFRKAYEYSFSSSPEP